MEYGWQEVDNFPNRIQLICKNTPLTTKMTDHQFILQQNVWYTCRRIRQTTSTQLTLSIVSFVYTRAQKLLLGNIICPQTKDLSGIVEEQFADVRVIPIYRL